MITLLESKSAQQLASSFDQPLSRRSRTRRDVSITSGQLLSLRPLLPSPNQSNTILTTPSSQYSARDLQVKLIDLVASSLVLETLPAATLLGPDHNKQPDEDASMNRGEP